MKKDFFWTLFRSVGQILIVFATEVILARALGKTSRGEFAACWSFINILAMVSLFGVETSSTYHLSSGRLTFSQVVGTCIYIGISCTLLFSLIGYALIHLPIEFFTKATPKQFMVVLIMIGPYLFFTYVVAILRGKHDFFSMNVFYLLNVASRMILTLLLCVWFKMGVVGGIISAIGGFMVVVLSAAVKLRKDIVAVEMIKSIVHVPKMIHYGLRSFFSYFANVMNIQLGVFIMGFFLAKEDLGFYAIAMAIAARIWIIPDSMFQVLMPKLAKEDHNREISVCRILRIIMIAVAIAAVGLALISKPLIYFAFGADYLPAVLAFNIILIGAVFRSAGKIITAFFFAIDRPGTNSCIKISGLIINILMLVILIPKYGLTGGAIGTAISYLLESLIMVVTFYKVAKIDSIARLIPNGSDLQVFKNMFVSVSSKALGTVGLKN